MLCIPFICTVSWFFGFCLFACFLLCRCFLWLYLWFPIHFVFLRDTCHPHACCLVCICLLFSLVYGHFLKLIFQVFNFLLLLRWLCFMNELNGTPRQASAGWWEIFLGYCFLKMSVFLTLTVGQQLLSSKGMPALFIFACTVSWKNTFLPKNWRGMY